MGVEGVGEWGGVDGEDGAGGDEREGWRRQVEGGGCFKVMGSADKGTVHTGVKMGVTFLYFGSRIQ